MTSVSREPLRQSLIRLFMLLSNISAKIRKREEDGSAEDYTDFDLIETVHKAGIQTICLDECHHLRSEWWKALEQFMEQVGKVKVISLTATPPYDSTPSQWKRYISMCGEIDEEIFVPELVQDESLCPHQDYVYFNYPSSAEHKQAMRFRTEMMNTYQELLADERFAELVASHKGISDPDQYADSLLDSPPYLASILIFLEYKKYPYPSKWLKILGVKKLPEMNMNYMEQLLQGVIFDDMESYDVSTAYRTELTVWLKKHKAVDGRKISMISNEAVKKMLIQSIGKLDSMEQIVRAEYHSMGEELHMLILTDFIRKEYQGSIGNPDMAIDKIGVVPIFEYLRRCMETTCRFGVLCGSLVILPEETKNGLEKLVETELGDSSRLLLETINDFEGNPLGYMNVRIRGSNQDIVKIITKVFEAGGMQVLVGTKSLLGEGWDSPCINSLILASFVGSFVLSNQMRGRAIRTYPAIPDKTSNIWHLVCLESGSETEENRIYGIPEEAISEDYALLSRRMKGFLGVSYSGETIENGINRLGLKKDRYTPKEVERINQDMIKQAMDREGLRKKWDQAITMYDHPEVVDENEFPREMLKPEARFFNMIGWMLIIMAIDIFSISVYAGLIKGGAMAILLSRYCSVLFTFLAIRVAGEMTKYMTPLGRLKEIGNGIQSALHDGGQVQSVCKVVVEDQMGIDFNICLFGATTREKDLFATCMEEFLGEIDNQRYLLYSRKKWKSMQSYYCVPSVFSGRKEDAELFRRTMERHIGHYHLVYTRNEEGRRILYKARRRAYGNRVETTWDSSAGRKKKVKGALE